MTSPTYDHALSEFELFGEEASTPGALEADRDAEEFFRKVARRGRRRGRRSRARGLRRVGVNAARAVLAGTDDLDDDYDDDDSELEWEAEDAFFNGLSPIRRVYPDAMIEHMAHMASIAENEFEAEQLMMPIVPMIASKLAPLEMMAAPGKGKPAPSHAAAAAGARPHAPGPRPHAAGVRPHAPGARPHAAGMRPHAPGVRPHMGGMRPHAPGMRPHPSGMRPQAPGVRPHHPGAMRHGLAHPGGLGRPHAPTSPIGHKAYAGVMRVAPALTKGIGRVTRTLHSNPVTRPLVRVVPTIARKTAATIARRSAQGHRITPKTATKILAHHTARTICQPGKCVHAYRHGKALDKHLHHTHPHMHRPATSAVQGAPGGGATPYAQTASNRRTSPGPAPAMHANAAPGYVGRTPVAQPAGTGHAPAASPAHAAASQQGTATGQAPTGYCQCACTCPQCGGTR